MSMEEYHAAYDRMMRGRLHQAEMRVREAAARVAGDCNFVYGPVRVPWSSPAYLPATAAPSFTELSVRVPYVTDDAARTLLVEMSLRRDVEQILREEGRL